MRRLANEDGQTIVLGMVLLVGLFAIFAVVLDVGASWTQRRNMQNVADAAALAGAQALDGTAIGADGAETIALEYVAKNVSNLAAAPTITFNDGVWTEIKVVVAKESPSFFLANFGIGDHDLAAKATARIASFNIIRCVVPIAVQDTVYFDGTTSGEDPPPLVELKSGMHEGDAGSNTGLVNLGPGNSAEPIRTGGGCGLEPMIPTKPGLTGGDVRNGFQDRLEAAMANDCYTWDDAKPDGLNWRCKPELAMIDGIEATAVVLLPVLHVDIDNSGSGSYPVAQIGGQYLLAYFWVDGGGTWDTSRGTWRCWENPDCIIRGRFIMNEPVDLKVFDPALCPGGNREDCILDFNPAATTKIVQLID